MKGGFSRWEVKKRERNRERGLSEERKNVSRKKSKHAIKKAQQSTQPRGSSRLKLVERLLPRAGRGLEQPQQPRRRRGRLPPAPPVRRALPLLAVLAAVVILAAPAAVRLGRFENVQRRLGVAAAGAQRGPCVRRPARRFQDSNCGAAWLPNPSLVSIQERLCLWNI